MYFFTIVICGGFSLSIKPFEEIHRGKKIIMVIKINPIEFQVFLILNQNL